MKKEKAKKETTQVKSPTAPLAKEPQVSQKQLNTALVLGSICVLGLLIYSNSFGCGFHLDDGSSIVENKAIQQWPSIKPIWELSRGRFVPYLTLAFNFHLGGLEVWGYHFVNLLIHLANACLVYFFTLQLFQTPALAVEPKSANRQLIAYFAALIFVAHPLATQSVTYIVQRMASMLTLFYLASVYCYLKARMLQTFSRASLTYYGASTLMAILAIFTKENVFALPLAILLVEACFLQTKPLGDLLKDKRILLAMGTIVLGLILVASTYPMQIFAAIPPQHGHTYTVTPLNYLWTQFSVILKYIQLLFLPLSLNLDYDYRIATQFFEIRTMLSFAALLGLVSLGVYLFKRHRMISFGIFWFLITLSIESSIIPIEDLIFEHRTYLPAVGFCILLSYGIWLFLGNRNRTAAIALLMLIVGSNAYLTYARNKVWKDEISLWTDVIAKSPNKARPYGTRADAYREKGETEKAMKDYDHAIQINPKYSTALLNKGVLFANNKQWDQAVQQYNQAIESNPDYTLAYFNRGNAYINMAQWSKALFDLGKVLERDPNSGKAHYGCGMSYSSLGQWEQAIQSFSSMIAVDPTYTNAYFHRGVAYSHLGQWAKVIEDNSTLLKLDPAYKTAWYNRGIAYGNLGKLDLAIQDYSAAIALDNRFLECYMNRGLAYGNTKQWAKAYDDFAKLVALEPRFPNAAANLQVAARNN